MSQRRKTMIAVIGPSQADGALLETARLVGQAIARQEWVLVTGGRGGVMEAASRGADQAGGLVLGILPGTSAEEANPHVAVPIVTGLSEARNAVLVLTADALIAVGRGYGTLSEIGLALKLGKPLVGLDSWPIPELATAATPDQAVAFVRQALAEKR
ncbi:MAG: hypothetical protein AMXMBFR83_17770 [Phycisphaerae bacterium]